MDVLRIQDGRHQCILLVKVIIKRRYRLEIREHFVLAARRWNDVRIMLAL